MALSPIKPSATISYESSSLTDSGLPITTISKADLTEFLNHVSGSVTFYFGGGSGTDVHLVLAENNGGTISSTNQIQSGVLPCPRYCK